MSSVDKEEYPWHFELADEINKAFKGKGIKAKVEPFDVYQGPFVYVSNDSSFQVGNKPYQMTIGGLQFWMDYHERWVEHHAIGIGSMDKPHQLSDSASVIKFIKKEIAKKKKVMV